MSVSSGELKADAASETTKSEKHWKIMRSAQAEEKIPSCYKQYMVLSYKVMPSTLILTVDATYYQ